MQRIFYKATWLQRTFLNLHMKEETMCHPWQELEAAQELGSRRPNAFSAKELTSRGMLWDGTYRASRKYTGKAALR